MYPSLQPVIGCSHADFMVGRVLELHTSVLLLLYVTSCYIDFYLIPTNSPLKENSIE